MRSPLSKPFAIAAILFIATSAYADLGSVSIGWDKNPEQDVIGYKVYFGTASGVYGQFDDVSQTMASVSDLTIGVRDTHTHCHSNSDGNSHTHSDSHSDSNSDGNSHTHTQTHSHSHRHSNSNSNSDSNAHSDSASRNRYSAH